LSSMKLDKRGLYRSASMNTTIDFSRYSGVMVIPLPQVQVLPASEAATYAEWFACLAEPVRVRLLHAVATSPQGITIGSLTDIVGVSQSTCSHHVRRLADVGFVLLRKE